MKWDGRRIVVLGTLDTKREALLFLARAIEEAGCAAILVDASVTERAGTDADYPADKVLETIGENLPKVSRMPRGKAVELMSAAAEALLRKLIESGQAHGILGVGGSGGTTICSSAMRSLPYGIPKVLVSTLASGNTKWHVDVSDIVMMPSLVDISGMNPMLELVLRNAAHAVCGMVGRFSPFVPSGKTVLAMTMYGTTTPGASVVRQRLEEAGFEVWTFHASGIGGRTMERLIREKRIHGVVDFTLAEIGAHLVGGLHDAGEKRLEAAIEMGLPEVIVPGAADTIVLPPLNEVPEKFKTRRLNVHNPTMTTMRTNAEENRAIADFIAGKLNAARSPVTVVLPLGGLSTIDRPGDVFFDPPANDALFTTLRERLSPRIKVVEGRGNVNDREFADMVADEALAIMGRTEEAGPGTEAP